MAAHFNEIIVDPAFLFVIFKYQFKTGEANLTLYVRKYKLSSGRNSMVEGQKQDVLTVVVHEPM